MNTKEQLIEHLKNNTQVLQTELIKSAFEKIDRADFVDADYKEEAYEDYPLPLSFGQTISQPTTVAFMLELLDPKPDCQILDVGSGSGYTTALLAQLANRGQVLGLEIIPELAQKGQENLEKYDFKNASIENKDSKSLETSGQKYDRILVNASAEEIPVNLFKILKKDGIMVVPVGGSIFKVIKKEGDQFETSEYPGFVFVPLK